MLQGDAYNKFRNTLLQEKTWPLLYMFKFIVPNHEGKVEQVKQLMPDHGRLSFKASKNLEYVSITCKAYMKTPDAIIEITQKATAVQGVIAL